MRTPRARGDDPRDPIEPTRPRWPDVVGAVGILLFLGWLVADVVALVSIPMGCAVETGFEVGYELVGQALTSWVVLLLVLGIGYLVAAFGAVVIHALDARARVVLAAVGLVLLLGTVSMDLWITDRVVQGELPRTSTYCAP